MDSRDKKTNDFFNGIVTIVRKRNGQESGKRTGLKN